MISLADELARVETEDRESSIDPAVWAEICAMTRTLDPPTSRAAYLPAAHWFDCQVGYHKSESHQDGDYHDLIATALRDVLIVLRDRKCRTAAELVALPGHALSGRDLAAVSVPSSRTSELAAELDADAQYYLDLGTDLGRVAAAAILYHANGAEYHGSATVADYHESEDAWEIAALEAACETVYDNECASLNNPLW